MVFNSTPDGFIEALDARTGELRWETKSSGRLTAGVIVVEGKVLSGRACPASRRLLYRRPRREDGQGSLALLHMASNEPGGDTWAGAPDETQAASTWALLGGYDQVRRLVYWARRRGANARQPSRRQQQRDPDRVACRSLQQLDDRAPAALPGKLRRTVPWRRLGRGLRQRAHASAHRFQSESEVREVVQPDVKRGEQRDVAVMVGEGGGIFVVDRGTGQFLWANLFPFDTPDFLISNVDGKTGRVSLNKSKLFNGPSERRVICYWNTRSYWPTAYHPGGQFVVVRTSRTAST